MKWLYGNGFYTTTKVVFPNGEMFYIEHNTEINGSAYLSAIKMSKPGTVPETLLELSYTNRELK